MMPSATIGGTTRVTDHEWRRRMDAALENLRRPPDPYEDDPALSTCDDPAEWLERAAGVRPWPMQAAIARAVATRPRVAVRSCNGAGKSFTAAGIVLWAVQTRDPVVVLTTAPTDRQVRNILWREVRKLHRRAPAPMLGRMLTQELHVAEDRFALGFTAPKDAGDKFQGFHGARMLVVVDEASGVSPEIFDAIDSITTGDATQLWISNPLEATGRFRAAFNDPDWTTFTIDAFACPNLAGPGIDLARIARDDWHDDWERYVAAGLAIPGMIDPPWVARQYRRGEESVFWRTRVMARFPDMGEDALIPLRLIVEAQEASHPPAPDDESELACDVARFGRDETVVYRRRGRQYRRAYRGAKKDLMHTAGVLVRLATETPNCRAVRVDETGLGGGLVDRLREVLPSSVRVIGVNAAGKAAKHDEYRNVRCEMHGEMAAALRRGELDIDPDDDRLAEQLAAVRVKRFTSDGQMQLEAKAEQKKRAAGASPDDADALALFFAPVSIRSFKHAGGVKGLNRRRSPRLDLGGY